MNSEIWDYFIYIGAGIIIIWLLWNVWKGRKVKVKDSYFVPDVKKVMWNPSKGLIKAFKSKHLIARLKFLNKLMSEEKGVVEESNKLKEERLYSKVLDDYEKKLKKGLD